MSIYTNKENSCENATATEVVMTLHFCITTVEGLECMHNKTSSNCNLEVSFHVTSIKILSEIQVYISEREPHLKSQHGFYSTGLELIHLLAKCEEPTKLGVKW